MPFKSSDEVYDYVGGVFEAAFADEEIGPRLRDTGIVLKVIATEPDATFILDMAAASVVRQGAVDTAAPSTMAMSAETHNAYWQGKINLPFAMARGKVKITGDVGQLLKLAPLGRKIYPVYIERLKADGRSDLLL